MILEDAVCLAIYTGLLIFLIYMTKVFLCRFKRYQTKHFLFFYIFCYIILALRFLNLTLSIVNFSNPEVKFSAIINSTEVFCVAGQLLIGFLQFDSFACVGIEMNLATKGLLDYRTSASDKLEKVTNNWNIFVHIYSAVFITFALAISIVFAVKEHSVDEKFKIFEQD